MSDEILKPIGSIITGATPATSNGENPTPITNSGTPPITENRPVGQIEIAAAIDRASNLATAKIDPASEPGAPPKRKRGRPRKYPAPTEFTDSGTQTEIPDPATTEAQVEGAAAPSPTFDEQAAEPIVDGLIGMLNDFSSILMNVAVKRLTNDQEVIAEATKNARMGETTHAMVKAGAMGCARKYLVNFQYAPEVALGGGLAIWGLGNYLAYKTIKASYTPAVPRQPVQNKPFIVEPDKN